MANPFMGEIRMFGGDFAPKDWAHCAGQFLQISQNQALYAVLGTNWGGDGRTIFALPDLRGRLPIGTGRGVGLTEVIIGQMKGQESSPLALAQMPTHNHQAVFTPTGGGGGGGTTVTVDIAVSKNTGTTPNPEDNIIAAVPGGFSGLDAYAASSAETGKLGGVTAFATGGGGGITGGDVTVGDTGASAPVSLMQPVLGMNFIIALQGVFPSRN